MSSLKIPKQDFQVFLDRLGDVNDSVILHVGEDEMYAITTSEDRTLFLKSSMMGEFNTTGTFNLPSVRKLSKSLKLIPSSEVEFIVNSNNLEYKGTTVRFKYHLFSDGVISAPKLSFAKIKSLKFDHTCTVDRQFFQSMLKNSTIFKDTKKLYIYTEAGKMVWSLGDKTMMNKDVLTVIGDDVDFEMEEFIINLDNLRLIDFGKEPSFELKISDLGVGNMGLKIGQTELNYIITSLSK